MSNSFHLLPDESRPPNQELFSAAKHCAYCGVPFGTRVKSLPIQRECIVKKEKEHFYPVAFGGKTTNANILAACQICNKNKGRLVFFDIQEASTFLRKQMFRQQWFAIDEDEVIRIGLNGRIDEP